MSSPSATPISLTDDAKPNVLCNGVPDLIYEEILAQGHAVWPSPDGGYIAAASFNDSGVRELPVLEYSHNIYPTIQLLRYPTVSTHIPEVAVWIYDMRNPQTQPQRMRLIPPDPIIE
ncbi:hypothetical protein SK128_024790 [Halocaridina rubra]|uniref:Dipeptidylpeptidase IV N-terminal domain-containing protein n=1 Tax=Halocaridina rubra TaxID=373956 RepID=A0AAN8X2I7_HALRR